MSDKTWRIPRRSHLRPIETIPVCDTPTVAPPHVRIATPSVLQEVRTPQPQELGCYGGRDVDDTYTVLAVLLLCYCFVMGYTIFTLCTGEWRQRPNTNHAHSLRRWP